MSEPTIIHVEWQKRMFMKHGYTAMAAESKAGYEIGDTIVHIDYEPKVFPKEWCVFPKVKQHESV